MRNLLLGYDMWGRPYKPDTHIARSGLVKNSPKEATWDGGGLRRKIGHSTKGRYVTTETLLDYVILPYYYISDLRNQDLLLQLRRCTAHFTHRDIWMRHPSLLILNHLVVIFWNACR